MLAHCSPKIFSESGTGQNLGEGKLPRVSDPALTHTRKYSAKKNSLRFSSPSSAFPQLSADVSFGIVHQERIAKHAHEVISFLSSRFRLLPK
jgi:hypothetical protein